MQRAANTDEPEKTEPELDISAELERRQVRLAAITAAKARLEERQRQSDAQRRRSPDDDRQPKGNDGKPKGSKPYQSDFGVPAPKAQDSFTDPESRIMKRAGGGFDYAYNAQTAVNEHRTLLWPPRWSTPARTSSNCPWCWTPSKRRRTPVQRQVLADTGYRNEAVMAELAQTQPHTERVIALGRDGKSSALCRG